VSKSSHIVTTQINIEKMAKKSLSLRLLFWLREIKNYCYDKLMAKFLHIVTAKDYSNELVKIITHIEKNWIKMVILRLIFWLGEFKILLRINLRQ